MYGQRDYYQRSPPAPVQSGEARRSYSHTSTLGTSHTLPVERRTYTTIHTSQASPSARRTSREGATLTSGGYAASSLKDDDGDRLMGLHDSFSRHLTTGSSSSHVRDAPATGRAVATTTSQSSRARDHQTRSVGGVATFTETHERMTIRAEYPDSPRYVQSDPHLARGSVGTAQQAILSGEQRTVDRQTRSVAQLVMPTYGGTLSDKSPVDFLLSLEDYAERMGYDEQDLLHTVLPVSLVGAARRWLRAYELEGYTTWSEFCRKFRLEFQANRLRQELERRDQGPEESFENFVDYVDDIYNKLKSYASQAERVQSVLQRALPRYKKLLAGRNTHTMQDLIDEVALGIQQEKLQKQYKPVPQPTVDQNYEYAKAAAAAARPAEPWADTRPLFGVPVQPQEQWGANLMASAWAKFNRGPNETQANPPQQPNWPARAPDVNWVEWGRFQQAALAQASASNFRFVPGVASIPRVGQGVANIPRIGQGVANIPRLGQSTANMPRVGQSTANIPRVGQSVTNITRVGQNVTNVTHVVNIPRVTRAVTNIPRVGQGVANVPNAGKGLINFPPVGQGSARNFNFVTGAAIGNARFPQPAATNVRNVAQGTTSNANLGSVSKNATQLAQLAALKRAAPLPLSKRAAKRARLAHQKVQETTRNFAVQVSVPKRTVQIQTDWDGENFTSVVNVEVKRARPNKNEGEQATTNQAELPQNPTTVENEVEVIQLDNDVEMDGKGKDAVVLNEDYIVLDDIDEVTSDDTAAQSTSQTAVVVEPAAEGVAEAVPEQSTENGTVAEATVEPMSIDDSASAVTESTPVETTALDIVQSVFVENAAAEIVQSVSVETTASEIVQSVSVETTASEIVQSVPVETAAPEIVQSVPAETAALEMVQTVSVETVASEIVQPMPVETAAPATVESVSVEVAAPAILEYVPKETVAEATADLENDVVVEFIREIKCEPDSDPEVIIVKDFDRMPVQLKIEKPWD